MRQLAAAIRREDGIALPLVMWTLLIIGTLSAVLLYTAMQASNQAVKARNQKAALSVADAALQTAVYRLNQATPTATSSGQCFTTTWANTVNGDCPADQENYGSFPNGGQFQYWVTPELSQTDGCTGAWIQNTSQPVAERCVTATGTVNGVTRRLEERIVSYQGATINFPVNGLFGLTGVNFHGNGTFHGDTGSNGHIFYTGGDQIYQQTGTAIGNVYYGPGGAVDNACKCNAIATTTYTQPTTPTAQFSASSQANSNSLIVWPPGAYNATNRTVSPPSGGWPATPVLVPPGVYNFCSLNLTGAHLTLTGGQAVFYVDSPYDPGSNCAAGTGALSTIGLTFDNPTSDPSKIVFVVYGDPGNPADYYTSVYVGSNTNPLYADFYAPNSNVIFATQGTNIFGQIAGYQVDGGTQSHFTAGGSQTVTLSSNSSQSFYPAAWHECPPEITAGSRAGCY